MNPSTQAPDEFFPEVLEAESVQSEHLTLLRWDVPKAEFAAYAGALTDALFKEQSAVKALIPQTMPSIPVFCTLDHPPVF